MRTTSTRGFVRRGFVCRGFVRTGLAVMAAALGACAESHAPADEIQLTYLATSVNGVSLPVMWTTSGQTSFVLERDAIQLLNGNRARRQQSIRTVNEGLHLFELNVSSSRYTVSTVGDTVTLSPECLSFAPCIMPTRLLREGDNLRLTLTTVPPREMIFTPQVLEY